MVYVIFGKGLQWDMAEKLVLEEELKYELQTKNASSVVEVISLFLRE